MLDFFGLFKVDTLYVVLGLIGVIVVLLVLYIVNIVKMSNLKKRLNKFMEGKDAKSLEDEVNTKFKEIEDLKASNVKNNSRLDAIEEEMLKVYKKVGIVKYDAFNEMGGKLSFALCCLDKTNNGYVINAMHSREGCYTYIKEIVNGEAYITLGDEEKQALDMAIEQDKTTVD